MGCLFEFFRQSSVYEAHACLHTYLKLQRRAIQHTPYIIKGLSGVQCIECLKMSSNLNITRNSVSNFIFHFIQEKAPIFFFEIQKNKLKQMVENKIK